MIDWLIDWVQNRTMSTTTIADLSIVLMNKSLNVRLIYVAQLIEHLPISRNDAGSKSIAWILTADNSSPVHHHTTVQHVKLLQFCDTSQTLNNYVLLISRGQQYSGMNGHRYLYYRCSIVLLRLSKSVPKPRFFNKTDRNRNRCFMPLCWLFLKRSSSSVSTVRWTLIVQYDSSRSLVSPRVLSSTSKLI